MATAVSAAAMVTDARDVDQILVLCSAIGMRDHDESTADVYHKGKECKEVLVDLTRMLRREDRHSKHGHLRQLGVFQVFEKDLVPLLIQYAGTVNEDTGERGKQTRRDNERMLFALLKLMVAMSMPAMMTFDGAADDKIEKTTEFAQQVDFLREYKAAMIHTWTMVATEADIANNRDLRYTTPAALEALLKILYRPLTDDLRTSKQEDIIELVLLMVRNLVHTPNDGASPFGRESLQDRAILAFEKVGLFELIVALAHDMEANSIFAGHLMEIVTYLLQDQTPAGLVNTRGKASSEAADAAERQRRRDEANAVLKGQIQKENDQQRHATTFRSARHSRFGGSFLVKSRGHEQSLPKVHISAVQSLKDNSRLSSDAGKTSKHRKKIGNTMLENPDRIGSNKSVRGILYKFAKSFLHQAYNNIMPVVYGSIEKSKGGDTLLRYDEVHYCKVLRFFMEFYRLDTDADIKDIEAKTARRKKKGKPVGDDDTDADKAAAEGEEDGKSKFDVGVIAATLRKEDVSYIKDLISKYATQAKDDVGGAVLWSQRLHHAIRAMHEVLVYLDFLTKHGNDTQRDFAVAMQADLFHEAEFLDCIPRIVKVFAPAKQSLGFARDLILLAHTLLKQLQTLQSTAKFKLYQARKRKVKKKTAKPAEGTAAAVGGVAAPDEAGPSQSQAPTDLAALFDDPADQATTLDAQTEIRITEFEFDFKDYVGKFAEFKVVRTYCEVLRDYKSNGSKVNHAIVKMLHRILDPVNCDMRWLFYQLSTFQLFRTILADLEVKKDPKFDEIRGFIKKGVIRNFFEDVKKYPPLFTEVLFWKSQEDVYQIELGPSRAELAKKTRSFKWTQAIEDRLRALYVEHNDEEHALDIIMTKLIDSFPEASERTSSGVKAKLNKMGLPLVSVSAWSDKELRSLKEMYQGFVEAGEADPIKAIVEEQAFHDSKNTYAKLRHRLKKMGMQIVSASSAPAWTEQQTDNLRELYAEFEGLDLGLKLTVEAIMEDPRMEEKTAGSIKHQLRELGLIKGGPVTTPWTDEDVVLVKELYTEHEAVHGKDIPPLVRAIMADEKWNKSKTNAAIKKKLKDLGLIVAPPQARKKAPPRGQQRSRRVGELDQDFAETLMAQSDRIRKAGEAETTQLEWLLSHMQARLDAIENGDGGFIAHEMPQSDQAAVLRPLIGMLGFASSDSDSDTSDSDSDDDDGSKKGKGKVRWAIDSSIPASRLRDMISVLQPDPVAADAANFLEDDGSSSEEELELGRTERSPEDAAQDRKKAMADLIAKKKRSTADKQRKKRMLSGTADSSDDDEMEHEQTAGKVADAGLAASRPHRTVQRRRLQGAFSSDEESSDSEAEAAPARKPADATDGDVAQIAASSAAPRPSQTNMVLDSDDSDSDSDDEADRAGPLAAAAAAATASSPAGSSPEEARGASQSAKHVPRAKKLAVSDESDSDADADADAVGSTEVDGSSAGDTISEPIGTGTETAISEPIGAGTETAISEPIGTGTETAISEPIGAGTETAREAEPASGTSKGAMKRPAVFETDSEDSSDDEADAGRGGAKHARTDAPAPAPAPAPAVASESAASPGSSNGSKRRAAASGDDGSPAKQARAETESGTENFQESTLY